MKRHLLSLIAVLVLGVTPVAAQGTMRASNPTTGLVDSLQSDGAGGLRVSQSHASQFSCNVAVSTATTLTAVGGSCVTPGAGLSLYITDISFGSSAASTTAADSFPTLKSGTGGTCGTATAVIWSAMTAANFTQVENLATPIKVTANSEVCWIHSVAGSKVLRIGGYIAP